MDQNFLNNFDPRILGNELQKARKRRGLTQEDAAKIIEAARTTITAIEKGERRIKIGELIKLADAYGCQVSDFVRTRPIIDELYKPQFRGPVEYSKEEEEQIDRWVGTLEQYCRDYLELERLLEAPLNRKYPPEYDSTGSRTEQAAESLAVNERHRLGLGDGPLPILRDILEQDVGLRIFYLPLQPSKFSAMYFYTEQLGGCIAVNSLHPEERRRWSLAHDYGHFLESRYKPLATFENMYQRAPESERFADAFARYFLLPTSSLARRFEDLHRLKEQTTLADLGSLAHYYGVSLAALTLRLEDMRLIPTGTWKKLKDRGINVGDLQRQLGLEQIPARAELLPPRYRYLAFEAWNQHQIGDPRFARLLGVDLLEARRIAQESQISTDGLAGEPSDELGSSAPLRS